MKMYALHGDSGCQTPRLARVLAVLLLLGAAASPTVLASDTNQATAPSQKAAVLPWISDVVKLSEAGVPAQVIQTYVKNSSARSTLTTDDVVYLQSRGISAEILSTMIEHGAAPAPQVAATATAPGQPMVTPGYGMTPPYQMTPQQTTQYQGPPVSYEDPSSVSVSYIPASYPNYYYSYYPYSYSYGYPYYYYGYPYYGYSYCGYPYYRYGYYGSSACFGGHVGGVSVGFVSSGHGGVPVGVSGTRGGFPGRANVGSSGGTGFRGGAPVRTSGTMAGGGGGMRSGGSFSANSVGMNGGGGARMGGGGGGSMGGSMRMASGGGRR